MDCVNVTFLCYFIARRRTKDRRTIIIPRAYRYFGYQSNHALNDHRPEISPFENRNHSAVPGLLIEYTNESLFPDLLAALRETVEPITWLFRASREGVKKWAGGEKRLKKREKEIARSGRGTTMETIDGIVWGANYLPGASCHRTWRSKDRGKVSSRRLSTSGYKVPPLLLLVLQSLIRYLDSESRLKISLPLRIFIVHGSPEPSEPLTYYYTQVLHQYLRFGRSFLGGTKGKI